MNNALTQQWESISNKFSTLNQRERWLVSGAILIFIYAAINMLLLEPALTHKKTLISSIANDEAQINALHQQINQLKQASISDPDAVNKQRIASLQNNLQSLENELHELQDTLVEPDKMPDLLRSLLQKNGRLKLISLNTLPSTSLLTDNLPDEQHEDTKTVLDSTPTSNLTATPLANRMPPAFKHGVEITLEGHYLDLLAYVTALEKTSWHVLWSKASLNPDTPLQQWPVNRLTLTLYTLSLDQSWLSI